MGNHKLSEEEDTGELKLSYKDLSAPLMYPPGIYEAIYVVSHVHGDELPDLHVLYRSEPFEIYDPGTLALLVLARD